jgi:hypothetical protein
MARMRIPMMSPIVLDDAAGGRRVGKGDEGPVHGLDDVAPIPRSRKTGSALRPIIGLALQSWRDPCAAASAVGRPRDGALRIALARIVRPRSMKPLSSTASGSPRRGASTLCFHLRAKIARAQSGEPMIEDLGHNWGNGRSEI